MDRKRTDASYRGSKIAAVAAMIIWLGVCITTLPAQSTKTRGIRRPAPSAQRPASSKRPQAANAKTTEKPQIVAVVNGESITRQQLAKQCLERYGEQVLESLVNKHLIRQACRKQDVRITNQHIEQEIATIASRFNLSVDRWMDLLAQERNITAEQYRRDIIWPTLALKGLAADKLVITDEQLRNEFESEYGPKVQTRMIAVGDPAKAEKLLALAKANPKEFGNLAKQHSEDPNSAAARGLIPHIRKHVGDPKVEEVCFALKPGEISQIVEVAGQFLIFKCERQLAETPITPSYRKMATAQLKEKIIDRQLRDQSTLLFQQLQSEAKIVNVYNDPEQRKKQPGVAATINGQRISIRQLAEECIARHGMPVLDSEINFKLLRQALKRSGKRVTESDIDAEIARAAESYGYIKKDDSPDVARWLKEITAQEGISVKVYVRDAVWPSVALKKLVSDEIKVTKEDLDRGFQANYGERVEVLAIVVGSQRVAQEVWNMARANQDPIFFGELAAQYSIEPVSKANMGEVPPVRRFSGQPKIEQEAFALSKENPLSAIVAIADKYVIMLYRGRTDPVVDSLKVVEVELRRNLEEKKVRVAMAQRFDDLKHGAQIDNFMAKTSQSGRQLAKPGTKPQRSKSPQLIRPASQRRQIAK